jgi:uncharacterized protein YraI
MTVQKFGRLCTAVGLAAGSALLSYPAAAQLYFQPPPPPPPPQVYYPPQADPGNFPPGARPIQVEPEGLPPPARTYDMPPKPRTANREDVPGTDAAPGIGENPENRENNVSVTTTTPVSAVSLRDGPSGSSSIIGTLRPGMPLEVLGAAKGGWVQVRSSAGTGWAYGSYLAIGTHGIAPASAGDVSTSGTQSTDVANTSAAKSAMAGNNAAKPPGTANPALAGGGPALAGGGPALGISRSTEPVRSGLASQITSP